jgi:hypothetical protein
VVVAADVVAGPFVEGSEYFSKPSCLTVDEVVVIGLVFAFVSFSCTLFVSTCDLKKLFKCLTLKLFFEIEKVFTVLQTGQQQQPLGQRHYD